MLRRVLLLAAILLTVAARSGTADTYTVDAAHTTVGFSVAHLVINKVHGTFNEFQGIIVLGSQTPATLQAVTGSIQAASIDTRIAKRDEHLRGPDFFDVEKFPQIAFHSAKVEKDGHQTMLVGAFTLHGVTKEVRVPVTLAGPIKDPWGKTRIGLETKLTINRKDYGLTWNKILEAGGVMVGEEITIEINAEAVKDEASAAKP